MRNVVEEWDEMERPRKERENERDIRERDLLLCTRKEQSEK